MTRRRRSNKIEEAMIDLAVVLAVAVLFRKGTLKRWQTMAGEWEWTTAKLRLYAPPQIGVGGMRRGSFSLPCRRR